MKLLLFFLTTFLLITSCGKLLAQSEHFADPNFYLIDSLDLKSFTESDRELLEDKLTTYHKYKDNDTARIDALEELVEEMNHKDWERYQTFQYNLILEVSKKKHSPEVSKKLKQSLATALNNFGYICSNQGKMEESYDYYLRSLQIREEVDHKEGIVTTYLNIGSNYDKQKQYEKALEYYNKALRVNEETGNAYNKAMCVNNIGTVLQKLGRRDEALKSFHEALDLYKQVDNDFGVAIILNNVGTIYREKGDLNKSLKFCKESLEMRKKLGLNNSMSVPLNNIGSAYTKLGKYAEAKKYLSEAMQYAEEYGSINQLNTSANNLYDYYKATNNPQKALEMYELHIKLKDSIESQKNYRASVELEAKYAYEKRRTADSIRSAEAEKASLMKLALQEEKAKKNSLKLEAQQRQMWLLIAGLAITVIFGFVMFQRFRITKRQKEVINAQKSETEKQKNQIEKQHAQLEETHKQISDSINYAERLQSAILPSNDTLRENLDNFFVFYQPKDVVSGDFYWTQRINGNIYLAVADCTGHGVPGAMVSVVCSNALNRSVKEFHLIQPSQILEKTRELVIETLSRGGHDVKDGMDISLVRINERKVTFAGAYNPLWVVRKSEFMSSSENEGGNAIVSEAFSLLEYKGDKQPIGLFDRMTPFSETEIPIFEGDTVYLFTDGFADQFGGDHGKKYKYRPFKQLLLEMQSLDMHDQKKRLDNQFNLWKGDFEQLDDVCVLGVRF